MFSFENRLRVISVSLFLFAFILVSKLYYLQIISGDKFLERAEHQYLAGDNYFDRGSIFFSTKDGALVPSATVRTGYTLSINSNIARNRNDLEQIYERLNSIVPIDKNIFFAKAKKENDPYEELAKRLDKNQAEAILALKIPTISVTRDRWRSYPGENMGSHVLGLIGYDSGNELAGRYGLEREYESVLHRDGEEVFINFFAEIFSNIKSAVNEEDSQGDIVTTIEPTVQAFLENELKKVNSDYSSEFTGGIIIDPNTGEIKAMALDPGFDPNNPASAQNAILFRNRLVEDRYEMGSIIKALTYASGLDLGVFNAKEAYRDPGCMTLNTETFCNYDGKSHGSAVTFQEALSKSLNTGAAIIAKRVGNKKFSEYLMNFGIGEKTGIDLPNEGVNLISNLKTLRDLELAQASFGQGIAMTPISTVRALSTLANGGTLVSPHLVREIRYKLGTTNKIEKEKAENRKRVISNESALEISRMLTVNVDKYLREGTMRLERYSIASKTGTAQIANPNGGGYYNDRYLHSFFGYFPSYESKMLVFLFTYNPKNVKFASETLTDAFFNTTKFLINYYDIPPDRESPTATNAR